MSDRTTGFWAMAVSVLIGVFSAAGSECQILIDHTCTDTNRVPAQAIAAAKAGLHIAYNHTSHGSQIISGMEALESFPPFGEPLPVVGQRRRRSRPRRRGHPMRRAGPQPGRLDRWPRGHALGHLHPGVPRLPGQRPRQRHHVVVVQHQRPRRPALCRQHGDAGRGVPGGRLRLHDRPRRGPGRGSDPGRRALQQRAHPPALPNPTAASSSTSPTSRPTTPTATTSGTVDLRDNLGLRRRQLGAGVDRRRSRHPSSPDSPPATGSPATAVATTAPTPTPRPRRT